MKFTDACKEVISDVKYFITSRDILYGFLFFTVLYTALIALVCGILWLWWAFSVSKRAVPVEMIVSAWLVFFASGYFSLVLHKMTKYCKEEDNS